MAVADYFAPETSGESNIITRSAAYGVPSAEYVCKGSERCSHKSASAAQTCDAYR